MNLVMIVLFAILGGAAVLASTRDITWGSATVVLFCATEYIIETAIVEAHKRLKKEVTE